MKLLLIRFRLDSLLQCCGACLLDVVPAWFSTVFWWTGGFSLGEGLSDNHGLVDMNPAEAQVADGDNAVNPEYPSVSPPGSEIGVRQFAYQDYFIIA